MTIQDAAAGAGESPLAPRLFATHDEFLRDRPPGADEDVHMVRAVVDHIIERCSAPGDTVFDPFAGFGTTLDRAVALGRAAIGIELLPERVEYVRQRVPRAHMVEGDARQLERLLQDAGVTQVDLIVSSPPYMTAEDHEPDPLTAYEENTGDYGRYLEELSLIASQCAKVVKPGGYVVWNVADIRHLGQTTHLIAGCAAALERHLERVSVTEISWDRYPHDLIKDALLVFRSRQAISRTAILG